MKKEREVEVTLHWGILTHEQRDKVYKARELLAEVGVTFDSDVTPIGDVCCWEFDFSLKGPLKVIFNRFKHGSIVGTNISERLRARIPEEELTDDENLMLEALAVIERLRYLDPHQVEAERIIREAAAIIGKPE